MTDNNQTKQHQSTFDVILNFMTGPFFGPIAFLSGGAGIGGYIAIESGAGLASGAVYGAVAGIAIWLVTVLYSWFG